MPTEHLSTKAPHNNSTGFLIIKTASANIPMRSWRKSSFLRKDPFDGQYMETRSFDIEARRGVLKFHPGGSSHLWTVWQLPTEDNFQDKKFWLQIARQNISWNVVKKAVMGHCYARRRGGQEGSAHPPQRQKGPAVSRKMWQARKCYILVSPVGLVGGRGGRGLDAVVRLAVPGTASQSLGPALEPGLVWLGLEVQGSGSRD